MTGSHCRDLYSELNAAPLFRPLAQTTQGYRRTLLCLALEIIRLVLSTQSMHAN